MELGPESQYADFHEVAMKLDKKPQLLLDFLLASFQSRAWSRKNEKQRIHLVVCITDSLVTKRLPFQETISKVTHIFKFYVSLNGLLSVSDFIVKASDGRNAFLSKLVLMRESPVLKEKFFSHRDLKSQRLEDFAPHLNYIDELFILYLLLYNNDTSQFTTLNTSSFTRILFQCREWQCPQIDELQKIFSLRIVDFSTASGELALSTFIHLPYLEAFSRAFLTNLNYITYTSTVTNHDNYIYNEPILDVGLNTIFFPNELIDLNRGLLSSGYEGSLQVDTHRVFITFQNETSAAIGWMHQPDVKSMKTIQRWRLDHKEEKLDPSRIKSLACIWDMKLPDFSLIGMLIHFTECTRLQLENYEEISESFLKVLTAKKNLKCLAVKNFKGSLDDLLPLISKCLPGLSSLEIVGGRLNLKALIFLLERGGISNLSLINCFIFSLNEPYAKEDVHPFKKLTKLALIQTEISAECLAIIFKRAINLESLALDCPLTHKPILPRSIKKLSAGNTLFCHYFEKGAITLFENLPHLKKIIIQKNTPDFIKKIIFNYFRNRSYEISFEK